MAPFLFISHQVFSRLYASLLTPFGPAKAVQIKDLSAKRECAPTGYFQGRVGGFSPQG